MAGLFYGEEKGGGVPVLFRHDLSGKIVDY